MTVWRYNGSGDWGQIKTIWRYNGAGDWTQVKSVWRYNGAGDWSQVFGPVGLPIPKTPFPELYFKWPDTFLTTDSPINGSKMFVTRGAWTEDPTIFRLRIQEQAPGGTWSALYDTTETYTEYLDADASDRFPSNANDASRPLITKTKTRQGYKFRGKVDVENSTGYINDYATVEIMPRMDFYINSFTVYDEKSDGGTFSWSFSASQTGNTVDDLLDIFSQNLNVYDESQVLLFSQSVPAGTTTYTLSNQLLTANNTYSVELEIIGQDGYAGTADPTNEFEYVDLTTVVTSPEIQTSPTLTLQSGTANSVGSTYRLSSGTWTNDPTQYRYAIELNDAPGTILAYYPSSTGYTTDTFYDHVFSATTSTTVTGWVIANNGSDSSPAYSSNSVGPITPQPPVNIGLPTISPLNNRSRVPVNTTLTAFRGTWSNVDANTTYEYYWVYDDGNTPTIVNWTTSSTLNGIPTSYAANGSVSVKVRATNTDGGTAESNFVSYSLDPRITVSSVSPTSVTQNVNTTFSYTINNYPTSYTVSWGDGTTNYSSGSISSNTATINGSLTHTYTTTGTKTITITAQPDSVSTSTNITVATPAPSASGFSRSDSTTTPSQPGTLSFSSSSNQVTTSWSNGSPITSVNFAASGAGVNTNYTDSSSPFMTSDVSGYTSSGTYSATVTNYNNSLQVTASWNQTNAQSYIIYYSSSVFGGDSISGNASGSSVSVPIAWSSGSGSFTFTGLTVYSGANQTGSSTFYSTGLSAITPTQKSSSRSGSVSLTYVAPNLTAPTIYSVSQSTPNGSLSVYFTGGSGPYYQIWWQSGNDYSSVTSYDASGTSSPVTDTSGPSAGTWYVAVRSVSSLTNTGSGPSSTISAWSSPVQFTVSQPTYTVTWNANGGSVSPSSSTVNQGSSVTAPTPTRSGYTFVRWTDTPSGDYTYTVLAGGSFTPPYSITMYARWQVVSSGTAPSTPTGLSNSYASGPSWTGSWSASSGTATITYYWTLYQSQSNGGAITATASGSTTGTSFTRSMSSANGLWAYFTVYASNSYGTSGTATSSWA